MNKITHLSVKGILSLTMAVICVTLGVTTVFAYGDTESNVKAIKSNIISTEQFTFKIMQEYPTTATTQKEEKTLKATEVTEPTEKATEATTKKTEPKEQKTEPKTEEKTKETSTVSTEQATTEPTEPEEEVILQQLPENNMTEEEKQALYQQQWDAGYLYAVEYPDYSYTQGHIELTEKDRLLCQRLCMGEFGSGGFIGAALIAQCIKDAMVFDGYKSVEDVRIKCRYTGRIDIEPTQEVIDAVSYIFDSDKPAVQHRLFYMYNPFLCRSAWHESQAYILTYEDVRFFDRCY